MPNIDINIKCGNSLISRYPLDADIKSALRSAKWNVDNYREAIMTYRNAPTKEVKRSMEELIEKIKGQFETEVARNDKRLQKLNKLKGELDTLTGQGVLFDKSKKEKDEWNRKVKKATDEMQKLESEIAEIKSNKIYENAFEWRFEFPEVLNNDGDFVGFDVVIGNPPYFSISTMKDTKGLEFYNTFNKAIDIYCLFYELGFLIIHRQGHLCYISSNKWMKARYGESLRRFLYEDTNTIRIIDFPQTLVFENATVFTNIFLGNKGGKTFSYPMTTVRDKISAADNFINYVFENQELVSVGNNSIGFVKSTINAINRKIEESGVELKDWKIDFYRGITTGLNDVFFINEETKNRLVKEDKKSSEIIKPLLRGKDIKRYSFNYEGIYLIFTRRGVDISYYPAIEKYLFQYKNLLVPRNANEQYGRKPGKYQWFEIQDNTAYYKAFEQDKITELSVNWLFIF